MPQFQVGDIVDFVRGNYIQENATPIIKVVCTPLDEMTKFNYLDVPPDRYVIEYPGGWNGSLLNLDPNKEYLFVNEDELTLTP